MSEKRRGLFNRMFSPNGDNSDEPSADQVARWLNEPDGRGGMRPSRPAPEWRPSHGGFQGGANQGPSTGTTGPSIGSSRPGGLGGSQAKAFSDLAAGFGGTQTGPWSAQDLDSGDDEGGGGVEVGDVGPGGPLAQAGVRAGDVIVAVDGNPVDDEEDLFDALGSLMPGRSAVLEIVRGDSRLTAAVIAPQ